MEPKKNVADLWSPFGGHQIIIVHCVVTEIIALLNQESYINVHDASIRRLLQIMRFFSLCQVPSNQWFLAMFLISQSKNGIRLRIYSELIKKVQKSSFFT